MNSNGEPIVSCIARPPEIATAHPPGLIDALQNVDIETPFVSVGVDAVAVVGHSFGHDYEGDVVYGIGVGSEVDAQGGVTFSVGSAGAVGIAPEEGSFTLDGNTFHLDGILTTGFLADIFDDGVRNGFIPRQQKGDQYDFDGDGTDDFFDPDYDGDNVPNHEDDDIDGDGVPNDQDDPFATEERPNPPFEIVPIPEHTPMPYPERPSRPLIVESDEELSTSADLPIL